ncbi:ATP-dependent Clp protease proteolytic subunit [Alphaproteobacteria bacterium endosymbiont of Tiliacea citrago]|uniref:ATP-dependent Clp protease proteolytic subunit n=1 Tax=Alphaproteobacteria bacterium endosymbiont of Tiliacea citrago TaxID=3077944 RepID=UPI00313AFDBB
MIIPTVVSEKERGSYDIFSYLLKNRIIFLSGGINDSVANVICAQLLFLEAENPEKDIYLYINSPGGSITSGLAIYDTMQLVKPDVQTWAMGLAASCGSFLLCSGAAGKRFSLPNTRIMLHEPSGGYEGRSVHIEDHANEVRFLREKLAELYSKHSKQSVDAIYKWFYRETFFSPEIAKEFGIIDHIKTLREDIIDIK